MPSSNAILSDLGALANDYWYVSALWHAVLALAALAMLAGWRPSRRHAGFALAALPASVAVLAASKGNPVNAVAFFALAAALVAITTRLSARPPELGSSWAALAGIASIAAGWVYPHFLDAPNAVVYLLAAPVGTLPCPTLLVLIGITLLGDGLSSRAWSLTLAGVGLLYGLFGMLWLGVLLDGALLIGSALLAVVVLQRERRQLGQRAAAT